MCVANPVSTETKTRFYSSREKKGARLVSRCSRVLNSEERPRGSSWVFRAGLTLPCPALPWHRIPIVPLSPAPTKTTHTLYPNSTSYLYPDSNPSLFLHANVPTRISTHTTPLTSASMSPLPYFYANVPTLTSTPKALSYFYPQCDLLFLPRRHLLLLPFS